MKATQRKHILYKFAHIAIAWWLLWLGPLPFYLQLPEHSQLISALEFQEVAFLSHRSPDPGNKQI